PDDRRARPRRPRTRDARADRGPCRGAARMRSRRDRRAPVETRCRNGRADGEEEVSRAGPWSGRARVGSRQSEEYGPPRVHDDSDDPAVARHGKVVDRSAGPQLLRRTVGGSEREELVAAVEDDRAPCRQETPPVDDRSRPPEGAVRTDGEERGLIEGVQGAVV